MSRTGRRLAVGAVLAGVAGYVAGLLTAPKSGKNSRKQLKKSAQSNIVEAEKQLKKLHTDVNQLINKSQPYLDKLSGEARKDLEKAVKSATKSKDKTREVLSVIHDGDISDKDLRVVIRDAKNAYTHLRTYLSKES